MNLKRRKYEYSNAAFIRRMRDTLGMTQRALADALKVHWLTVSKWERADPRQPSDARVKQVRELLKGKK